MDEKAAWARHNRRCGAWLSVNMWVFNVAGVALLTDACIEWRPYIAVAAAICFAAGVVFQRWRAAVQSRTALDAPRRGNARDA